VRTAATILANPRYTGRQLWNRQRTDVELVDPADVALGHRGLQRWNLPDGWVISARPAHEALVIKVDFIAAQDISAARGPPPDPVPPRPHHRRPAGPGTAEERSRARGSHPDVRTTATAEDAIGDLREQQITLTYDPATSTLCAGTAEDAQTIALTAR
jgi:hypothetical protein